MPVITLALFVLAAPLDRPVRVVKVPVTARIALAGDKFADDPATLTCSYYRDFVVKQVDNPNDKGADRLSFARFMDDQPGCALEPVFGEVIIANALVGSSVVTAEAAYFLGALGDWAIFDADDGIGNGMPFTIYDTRTDKKIYLDMREGDLDVQPTVVRYRRLFQPDCSVLVDAKCRRAVSNELGIKASFAALCRPAYAKAKVAENTPSAISVDGVLERSTLTYTAKQGGRVACWPMP